MALTRDSLDRILALLMESSLVKETGKAPRDQIVAVLKEVDSARFPDDDAAHKVLKQFGNRVELADEYFVEKDGGSPGFVTWLGETKDSYFQHMASVKGCPECEGVGLDGNGSGWYPRTCPACGRKGDNPPCFAGNATVELGDGSRVRLDAIQKGTQVWTPVGPAEVVCVVRTACKMAWHLLSEVRPGLLATPGHPVQVDGVWQQAETIARPKLHPCTHIYNLVLSQGHVIAINDIHSVTLGHGLEEKGLAHDYWGTQLVVDELRTEKGWAEGLVDRSVDASSYADMQQQGKFLLELPQASASDSTKISEALLCGIQASGVGGEGAKAQFRSSSIRIRGAAKHVPPEGAEVAALVAEHLERTRQLLGEGAAPFDLAAYALWWINTVHPFEDGNGRLARGVAFWLLQPATGNDSADEGLSAKIRSWHEQFRGKQRREYFEALQEANERCGLCKCCGDGKGPGSFTLDNFERLATLLKNVVAPTNALH